MPSVRSVFAAAAALVSLASADTIKVTATSGNKFDPDTIKAAAQDVVEFHFEPKNHSVVAGDYRYPCSPLQIGTGFFSGYIPSDNGEADKVFRVTINSTAPIAIYSSQGEECASGMVAIINPTDTTNLTDYKKRASTLSRAVTPGRVAFGGVVADNSGSAGSSSSSGGDDGKGGKGDGKKSAAVSVHTPVLGLVGGAALGLAVFSYMA